MALSPEHTLDLKGFNFGIFHYFTFLDIEIFLEDDEQWDKSGGPSHSLQEHYLSWGLDFNIFIVMITVLISMVTVFW